MVDERIAEAAKQLRDGGLVAFPTETVYGLGADATSPEAVARIFAAKGRPRFNPLIAHIAEAGQAAAEAIFTPDAHRLADSFWPGPLTLVLPRAPDGSICDLACAGLTSVGLRVPAHALARELLNRVGRPIAAPSANRSGRLSPTRAEEVAADLGDTVDMILDGGACEVGVESTIVACLGDRIALLRPGGIAREAIEEVVGRPLAEAGSRVRAPGMLASHYAPKATLRLDAGEIMDGEIGLAFAGNLSGAALDLSPRGDLREAAASLYRHLRWLDASGVETIAVGSVPDQDLGCAINDRLRRAAAPRPT